jgi:hypothetical protein
LGRISAYFSLFSGVVECCFCWGFCEISVADGGILMVSLWWIGGKRWLLNDHLFLAENFSLF